jgi:dipeptidyl aminopeptidase/acylaminoacyl peptidase
MANRREFLTAAGAIAGLAAVVGARPARAQVRPATLDELYSPSATPDAAISPNGRRVAVLRNRTTGKGGLESSVDIVDAEAAQQPPKTIKLGDYEAIRIAWANDKRLLVWMLYDVTKKGLWTERIVRVVAMDDDGGNPAPLFGNRDLTLQYIHDLGEIVDDLPADPDHVLMYAWEPIRGLPALHSVNVNDGVATVLEFGALRTLNWLTQGGRPMIRLDADRRSAVIRVMARAPSDRDWKFVRAITADQQQDFDVLGATQKPGVFYCTARLAGEDKVTVREVALASLDIGPPLFPAVDVDADGAWIDRQGRLVGMTWQDDRRRYAFTDKGFQPHLTAIEKYFGAESSVTFRQSNPAQSRYLGLVEGPREAGAWFLYDRNSHAIVELGQVRPEFTPDRLAGMQAMDVRTRDGGRIRAYLTVPPGGAPGPLVVMPHGGPEVRDTYGFNVWAQAMAARGWWVLQPNFRGSGGYGLEFAKAGWRRWGDRMQEDVEDAVDQAIAEHRLDSKRVAIVGGSYGGYAALMAGVRRPDLYKAIVSIAGISDLKSMLEWERKEDDSPEKARVAFWRLRIGDPDADAEMLARASPRQRAAEIRAPVLLIHGRSDDIVPIEQSRTMAKALKAANKPVRVEETNWEGHAASSPAADRARLELCLDFLAKALA